MKFRIYENQGSPLTLTCRDGDEKHSLVFAEPAKNMKAVLYQKQKKIFEKVAQASRIEQSLLKLSQGGKVDLTLHDGVWTLVVTSPDKLSTHKEVNEDLFMAIDDALIAELVLKSEAL